MNAISYNRKMMHLLHSDQDLDGLREKGCWDPGGSQAWSGKKAGRCWCGILGLGWVNFGFRSSQSMLSSQTCDKPLGLQWA